ncbi:MAG: transglycosylase SLT domain-containing protein [Pusillimonas sp.]
MNSPQDATFSDQVALLQQSDNAATAPDTELEALGSLHIETLAEEARKLAQTKYLAEKFGQQPATVRKYVDLAWAEADKRDGIEPELLIAIMQKESSLRPRVQSRYGAQGLMQVVRRWHHDKLSPSESLFDPEVNIRVGADILEEYLELAGGSLIKALGKYSGSARGYPNRILKESRKLAQVAEQAATSG